MAMRVVAARAGLAAALLAVFGLLSPVEAGVLWRSADGARLMVRNSAGVPVVVDNAFAKLPVSTSGGAGAMRAGQVLSAPGVSAELTLSRAISAANIARGLRIATGLLGPVGMIGLAYEGIVWATDHWEALQGGQPESLWKEGCTGPYAAQFTTVNQICWGVDAYEYVTYYPGPANTPPGAVPAGWENANNVQCSVSPAACGGTTAGWGGIARRLKKTCAVGHADIAGNCPSYGAASDAQVETSLTNALQADPSKAGPMIEWVAEAVPLYDFQPGPIEVSGPSSVAGPVTTTTKQEGGQTYTTTNQTTYNLTFQGDTVTVTTTTNSTTVDASNNVVSQSTTTTEAPSSPERVPAPQEKAKDPCGLPGTPPCKIDETGTPTAESTVSAGQQALKTAFDARDQQLAQNTQRESFGWVPTLPTLVASCSTIQVGNIWTFDPCPGIEIGRTFFAFLWGFLALVYCWRRVGETVAGGV